MEQKKNNMLNPKHCHGQFQSGKTQYFPLFFCHRNFINYGVLNLCLCLLPSVNCAKAHKAQPSHSEKNSWQSCTSKRLTNVKKKNHITENPSLRSMRTSDAKKGEKGRIHTCAKISCVEKPLILRGVNKNTCDFYKRKKPTFFRICADVIAAWNALGMKATTKFPIWMRGCDSS